MNLIKKANKEKFGNDSLLPGQKEMIVGALNRKDTFAIIPTGGGKSLSYWLPAYLEEGITFIISPLIALMKD